MTRRESGATEAVFCRWMKHLSCAQWIFPEDLILCSMENLRPTAWDIWIRRWWRNFSMPFLIPQEWICISGCFPAETTTIWSRRCSRLLQRHWIRQRSLIRGSRISFLPKEVCSWQFTCITCEIWLEKKRSDVSKICADRFVWKGMNINMEHKISWQQFT